MRKRIESFQVLRGATILLIFLSHCDHLLDIGGKNRLGQLGACGVSLFIALSGFLAAYRYSELDPPNWIEAYKAKWKKFGWLHTITLLAAIPFSFTLFRKNVIQWGATLVLNMALLQAWIPKKSVYFSFNAVSWYLSITLFFVIITPVAVKIWKCLDTKRTLACSAVLLISELSLCFFVQDKAYSHWIVYVFPITRALDFIIGGGYYKIAKSLQNGKENAATWLLLCSVVALTILGITSSVFINEYYSTSVWTLPSCWLIMALFLNAGKLNNVVSKAFFSLGNVSFEFFMIHQLVLRYCDTLLRRLGITVFFGYFLSFVLSFAAAYVLHNRKKILGKIKNEQS